MGLRQIAFSEDCVLDLSASSNGQHTSQILVDWCRVLSRRGGIPVGSGVADDGA